MIRGYPLLSGTMPVNTCQLIPELSTFLELWFTCVYILYISFIEDSYDV